MNDKFSFKDPHNLKREIQNLISFEEKNQLLNLREQMENKDVHRKDPFSKYSRVLNCSFVNPNLDKVVQTKSTGPAKGIPVQKREFSTQSKTEIHPLSKGA